MSAIATQYQPLVRTENGPYRAAALVGTHGVILGWDADRAVRKGLMGFAVRRTDFDPATGEAQRIDWLSGQKRFPGVHDAAGIDIRSDQAPFQRFRWSDYTVTDRCAYRYEIFPMRGVPGDLKRDKALVVDLRPSPETVDGTGVFVNRGVTAAHAYLRRFGLQKPQEVSEGRALSWLSRGLKESLLAFLATAQGGDALRVAIYEIHDAEVGGALRAALDRGVDVRIVVHAVDPAQRTVRENLHRLEESGLLDAVAARRTEVRISHNKFVVLLRGGKPRALWTGSANFTHNAFYLQTNAALTFDDPGIAGAYLDYWTVLAANPERGRRPAALTFAPEQIEKVMADVKARLQGKPGSVFFSPVRRVHLLDTAAEIIGSAKTALFFSAPFGMDKSLKEALAANDERVLEYGLCNTTARRFIEGLDRKNTRFFVPTRLETYAGKAWDSKAFGAHKIHSKLIVADPWSEGPRVLFGSANLSDESCRYNDENAVLIEGDQRLAAILASELLRMYDHYKSRGFINDVFKGKVTNLELDTTEAWSRTAYDPGSRSHKFRDRQVFSGQV